MVSVQEAARVIGVSEPCLMSNTPKYRNFFVKSPAGMKNALFDLQGFLKFDDLSLQLIEKTKLLIEYLYHIEGMNYNQIASLADVNFITISRMDFGYKAALKITRAVRDKKPYHLERFDKYYGWKHVKKNTRRKNA